MVSRIETVKQWDRHHPETLRDTYVGMSYIDDLSDEEFEILRSEFIRLAKERLVQLKLVEDKIAQKAAVESADINMKIAQLLQWIRPTARLSRNANYIDRHFGKEQRFILYDLLNELYENVPWYFPCGEAFETISKHKLEMHKRNKGQAR